MQSEVKFAGFGGQGILLIGKVLAHAAMEEGFEVAWVPSYGPEMRGGTAYCTVVVSAIDPSVHPSSKIRCTWLP
jgi:2-oxoglutarate ferredoxin oxidoreductase subunit gamma